MDQFNGNSDIKTVPSIHNSTFCKTASSTRTLRGICAIVITNWAAGKTSSYVNQTAFFDQTEQSRRNFFLASSEELDFFSGSNEILISID
ncbi:hypothetical protein DWB84_14505 [Saccharophagus sp. K07]|nr:hypothetical protein [Saccharophagus sp. K07]